MAWLIVSVLLVFLMAMGVSFARNARAIKRDFNQRFNAFEVQLEHEANAIVDTLLSRRDEKPR